MKEVSEKQVESYLKKKMERVVGVLCWKFISPGISGVPDRAILLPHGLVIWVEVKRPGAKPRPMQSSIHSLMAKYGHIVLTVDSYKSVDVLAEYCQSVIDAMYAEQLIPVPPDELKATQMGVMQNGVSGKRVSGVLHSKDH